LTTCWPGRCRPPATSAGCPGAASTARPGVSLAAPIRHPGPCAVQLDRIDLPGVFDRLWRVELVGVYGDGDLPRPDRLGNSRHAGLDPLTQIRDIEAVEVLPPPRDVVILRRSGISQLERRRLHVAWIAKPVPQERFLVRAQPVGVYRWPHRDNIVGEAHGRVPRTILPTMPVASRSGASNRCE
jgi:hypothetical protein